MFFEWKKTRVGMPLGKRGSSPSVPYMSLHKVCEIRKNLNSVYIPNCREFLQRRESYRAAVHLMLGPLVMLVSARWWACLPSLLLVFAFLPVSYQLAVSILPLCVRGWGFVLCIFSPVLRLGLSLVAVFVRWTCVGILTRIASGRS